jgi:CBS domain-containing protein
MIAKNVMTRDVIAVKPEDSIEKAARLLIENKISGIPVVDDDNCVLGIITERDLIIKAADLKVPFYITLFDSIIFLENPIRFNKELKKYSASLVKDAMTYNVVVIEEEKPVSEVVEIMKRKNINRVPVVKNNKLVGIVTRNDILKSLVKSDG